MLLVTLYLSKTKARYPISVVVHFCCLQCQFFYLFIYIYFLIWHSNSLSPYPPGYILAAGRGLQQRPNAIGSCRALPLSKPIQAKLCGLRRGLRRRAVSFSLWWLDQEEEEDEEEEEQEGRLSFFFICTDGHVSTEQTLAGVTVLQSPSAGGRSVPDVSELR